MTASHEAFKLLQAALQNGQKSGAQQHRQRLGPELSRALAHELANACDVLANVLGLLSLETGISVKGKECLGLAQEELARVITLFREAATAPDSAEPRMTDVVRVVSETVEVYRSRFDMRGIKVRTRFRSAPAVARPAVLLREIVANLLLNAIDATRAGGTIYLRVAEAKEWSGSHRSGVKILVADTGSGIPPDVLPHIFEQRFTTKGAHGTGIGLALVKRAVDKLGARLQLRTSTRKLHSGTAFMVFIAGGAAMPYPRRGATVDLAREVREQAHTLRVKSEQLIAALEESLTPASPPASRSECKVREKLKRR